MKLQGGEILLNALLDDPLPLKNILTRTPGIFTALVDTLDPEKGLVILNVVENLKGAVPHRKLLISLDPDAKDAGENHRPSGFIKRLALRQSVIGFADGTEGVFGPIPKGKQSVLLYTNGTWTRFLTEVSAGGAPAVSLLFQNFEPYLQRTFKGTTEELRQVIMDALAGKKEPPVYNFTEKGGLGPVKDPPSGNPK
jgi:hypothetical protein